MLQGKRILVTGGAGAIGSNLAQRLVAEGARVVVLDDLSAAPLWNLPTDPNIAFIRGDVRNTSDLQEVFADRPDIVIHLAAHFANERSLEHADEDLLINGMGTLRVLQHSHAVGVQRFVYASSSAAVYGPDAPVPFREDYSTMRLHTPYQISKALGELYCNFFDEYYHLPVVKLRIFNSYGPGEMPGKYRNVVPNQMCRALRRQPLIITGAGSETRDFTYVDDIVDGIVRSCVVSGAVGLAFNLASGKETTASELAQMVNRVTDNPAGVVFRGRRAWDKTTRRWANIDRARSVLGYRPQVSLEEGLLRTMDWFTRHSDTICPEETLADLQ